MGPVVSHVPIWEVDQLTNLISAGIHGQTITETDILPMSKIRNLRIVIVRIYLSVNEGVDPNRVLSDLLNDVVHWNSSDRNPISLAYSP